MDKTLGFKYEDLNFIHFLLVVRLGTETGESLE